MQVTEKPNLTPVVSALWNNWFPNKETSADDIPRVVANRDWLRECLIFYGWADNKNMKPLQIRFIDGGAVLYYDEAPCALISVIDAQLRFTYVDNRAQ
jgi:hypothetical protein